MKNRFISKEVFFDVFDDVSIFQGKFYNYFRVAQSGLFSQYAERQKRQSILFLFNKLGLRFLFCIKNLTSKKKKVNNKNSPFLFLACGRIDFINDNWKSIYLDTLINFFGKNSCHINFMVDSPADPSINDSSNIEVFGRNMKLTSRNYDLFKDLKYVLKMIKKHKGLSKIEKQNIEASFVFFYKSFIYYRSFLNEFKNIEKLFIYPAYQNEAIVLAAIENNIEVVELQHGIIGKDSRFYVYPEQIIPFRANSILPNKIFVWGKYWEERLIQGYEYLPNQIKVVGDFILRKELVASEKEEILLITVSRKMQQFFVPFIEKQLSFIKSKHPGWKILLKLHPSDSARKEYQNEFGQSELVQIARKEQTIEDCLKFAKIQAGTYSMVLFESLGAIEACFSIVFENSINQNVDEYGKFQEEMKDAKVADVSNEDSDLIDLFKKGNFSKRADRNNVFKNLDFDSNLFLKKNKVI